jgi:small-conductance mechanosensitive channel/CRP-like cAMP-binding protein
MAAGSGYDESASRVAQLTIGIVILLAALALRAITVNRHVRRKLAISCALLAAYVVGAAIVASPAVSDDARRQVGSLLPVLLAFGLINAIVALAINPWRIDRIPDQFPNIVQDALIIALFGLAATLFFRDRFLATTAVGAVVLGLALQDTLGNLFAGLAIQIEKPFRVGHWVTIGGENGLVSEITWRATKIRTKAGNFVIVPNSVLAKDTITNFSEPTLETRVEVEIGASYDTPPNDVKAAVREAIRDEPLILPDREPEVLLADFAASAIVYRVRVWTTDFAADERIRDRLRTHIYYAFRRLGIVIPYPIQVEIQQEATAAVGPTALADALRSVEIFAALTDRQRADLASASRPALYAAGEKIVREGDTGSSMFVIRRGDATVRLAGTDGEVARLGPGDFFGEMSLLTGEPRSATVSAATDCELVELGADGFRRVVLADPALVERVAAAVVSRRTELEAHRLERGARSAAPEAPQTLVVRIRQFLRLSLS